MTLLDVRDLTVTYPGGAAAVRGVDLRLDAGIDIIGVGVDRLDYTKGIPERLCAIDRLLTRHPDLRQRLAFVQVLLLEPASHWTCIEKLESLS